MPTYTAYNNYLLQLTYSNGAAKSALDVQLPNLMQVRCLLKFILLKFNFIAFVWGEIAF